MKLRRGRPSNSAALGMTADQKSVMYRRYLIRVVGQLRAGANAASYAAHDNIVSCGLVGRLSGCRPHGTARGFGFSIWRTLCAAKLQHGGGGGGLRDIVITAVGVTTSSIIGALGHTGRTSQCLQLRSQPLQPGLMYRVLGGGLRTLNDCKVNFFHL